MVTKFGFVLLVGNDFALVVPLAHLRKDMTAHHHLEISFYRRHTLQSLPVQYVFLLISEM